MMTQHSLEQLNVMSAADFVSALANVFEYSPWIAEAAATQRPFPDVKALFATMSGAIAAAPLDARLKLIKAHPDLADKTQRADELTEDSAAEQNSAGLDRLSEAEYDAFTLANTSYREKFGFPFVVCVRRHSRDSILRNFNDRLKNDAAMETAAALAEIERIGALRLDTLVTGSSRLPVHGRLSTHVLDTTSGKPAAGIAVELAELSKHGPERIIARAVTNHDGRTDTPLIGNRPVPMGQYELRFAVADYFKAQGHTVGEPAFLDVVPLRFGVSNPEGHYHVPLLVTPWSFSTYRGS